tara:strand:- start:352 stop:537 length:186 start_codon:yes stop_codon:yes gene_type:complete
VSLVLPVVVGEADHQYPAAEAVMEGQSFSQVAEVEVGESQPFWLMVEAVVEAGLLSVLPNC